MRRLKLEWRIPAGALSADKAPDRPPAETRLVPLVPDRSQPEAPKEAESKAETER